MFFLSTCVQSIFEINCLLFKLKFRKAVIDNVDNSYFMKEIHLKLFLRSLLARDLEGNLNTNVEVEDIPDGSYDIERLTQSEYETALFPK